MPISIAENFPPGWARILIGIFLIATPLVAVWFRSGSTHTIWSRLWRLANGKGSKTQSELQRTLAERDSLMEFRVRTGVKARTTKLATTILKWCDEHDEEIGDVGKCGFYFDTEMVELKKAPLLWVQIPIYIVLVALLVINLFMVCALTAPRLWSIVPSSDKPWVMLGENDARTWLTHHRFSVDDCTNLKIGAVATQAGISKDSVQIVCDWLKDPKYKLDLSRQINAQRASSAYLLAVLFLPSYLSYMFFTAGIAATKMHSRQKARCKTSSLQDRECDSMTSLATPESNTNKRTRFRWHINASKSEAETT